MLFLSTEWIEVASTALQDSAAFQRAAARTKFAFLVRTTNTPDWAQEATLRVNRGKISLTPGRQSRTDATGIATYEDWLAMLRHELHPRTAALTGRLHGRGGLRVLRQHKLIDAMLDVLRTIPVEG